jgi:hypothetical protein
MMDLGLVGVRSSGPDAKILNATLTAQIMVAIVLLMGNCFWAG